MLLVNYQEDRTHSGEKTKKGKPVQLKWILPKTIIFIESKFLLIYLLEESRKPPLLEQELELIQYKKPQRETLDIIKKHKWTPLGLLSLIPGWTGRPIAQEELQTQGVDLIQNC